MKPHGTLEYGPGLRALAHTCYQLSKVYPPPWEGSWPSTAQLGAPKTQPSFPSLSEYCCPLPLVMAWHAGRESQGEVCIVCSAKSY